MSASALLAMAAAAAAAALAVPGRPRSPAPESAEGRGPRSQTLGPVGVAGALVVGLLFVGRGSPRLVVLGVVLVAACLAGRRLWRARAARLAAGATAARVLETCESLAAELAAGRPSALALDRAAEDWPALGPVAEAHRVGADVPAAWRSLAERPGAADLRVVAAAWQVAHRTGEGLADTLDRVALGLRDAQATRRVVEGELASARATARLVAALPLLALSMGNGAGGDPWGFLLTTPVGLGCLALGIAFAFAGLAWIEALAREVDRP
ncbi:type II secretion system F family protein [Nocardioides rubriscoriae]|uniref:type II secretion system F family protein n=1 Tax=Nocardioides rubriscoriae TaxID=642762 RepID=UPI0011DF4CAD|nr:type II secretion system F family protein [Nocardioides rubriscoriae]